MTAHVLGTVAASGWRMHDYTGSGWWMGGMMIWMVVFWVAVCVGVMWLVRPGWGSFSAPSGRGSRDPSAHDGDALVTLDRRFAEGAISSDEYRERKAILKGEHVDVANLGSGQSTSERTGT